MTLATATALCGACSGPAPFAATFCPRCGARLSVSLASQSSSLLVTFSPLVEWLRDERWWRSQSALFAAFALAPFVVLKASAGLPPRDAAWGFAAYFGLMWALVIHRLVRPERQSAWLIVRVVLATAVFGSALAVPLERWVTPKHPGLLGYVLGVGVPEELVKALPVLLFLWTSRTSWSPRTYLFVGAMSGLAFGVVEAVEYSSLYEQLAHWTGRSFTSESIWRLVCGGLLHACMAAITGYFIGLAYWQRRAAPALLALGLALTSALHGAYDDRSDGWFGAGIAAVIIIAFSCYVRSADELALRVAQPSRSRS